MAPLVHLLVLAIEHLVLNISINSLNIEHRSERGEGFQEGMTARVRDWFFKTARSLQIILLLSSSPLQREELWEGRHSSEISGTVAKVITVICA